MRWKKKLSRRLSQIHLSWGIYVMAVGKGNSGITALIKKKKTQRKASLERFLLAGCCWRRFTFQNLTLISADRFNWASLGADNDLGSEKWRYREREKMYHGYMNQLVFTHLFF